MKITRREFVRTASALGVAAMLPRRAPGAHADSFFTWTTVHDQVRMGSGSGGNSTVIVGKDTALLVDTKNSPFGKQLRREAEALLPTLAFVVNTHHHADHTGGNHAFSKDVPIVAHERCGPRVLDQVSRYISQIKESTAQLKGREGAAAEQVRADAMELYKSVTELKGVNFAPTQMFAKDRDLEVGGVKVRLHHFGAGHTDNDIVLHLPDQNVLVTGDLLFNKSWPHCDRAGGCDTAAWISACEQCLGLCDAKTKVIPGHGELGDKAALQRQIDVLEEVRDMAAKAVKDGVAKTEFVKSAPEKFKSLNGGETTRPITLGAAWDEARGEPVK